LTLNAIVAVKESLFKGLALCGSESGSIGARRAV